MRRWVIAAAAMILFPWIVSLTWMKASGREAEVAQLQPERGQAEGEGPKGQGGNGEEGDFESGGESPGPEGGEGETGSEAVEGGAMGEGIAASSDGKAVEDVASPHVLRKILVKRQGMQTYIELEDYLPGVMACQVGGDCQEEALKCQAVVARTYLYRLMDGRTEVYEEELDLDYLGESQAALGADKEKLLNRLERCRAAAEATRGVVMKYDGRYILPLFHPISAGRTRNGDQEFPYLQSVESGADTKREDYMQVKEWGRGEFAAAINQISDGSPVAPEQLPEQIQTVRRDDAGYMVEIKIGAKTYSGDQVQYALGLPSPCFSLEGDQDVIRARIRGKGHGYGLSQAGADSMAREGWGYEDILNHYYKNILLISE